MKLFDLDGPLFSAMSTLTNLVVLNLMFCICCIPIITIGASSAALHECVQELLEEKKEKGLIRRFLKSFKKNFGRSTIIWCFSLIIFVILFLYQRVVNMMEGSMGQSYQIVFYILCFIFLFGFQYLFPMQAKFNRPVRFTLKYSWLLSIAALPWTLAGLAATGILVYVSFFMNANVIWTALYLWLIAGFAIVAYIDNIFYLKAFKKMMPKEDKPDEN
ncbi:MAG: DUF624 domain-containing protein [Schaedlerella sp.]|nr:DUF624 domain-containing protein [Schaedlerella sp.]